MNPGNDPDVKIFKISNSLPYKQGHCYKLAPDKGPDKYLFNCDRRFLYINCDRILKRFMLCAKSYLTLYVANPSLKVRVSDYSEGPRVGFGKSTT